MIYIEPCAGLGNRFIGLACAYYAARETHQPLTVVWKKESVLAASANSLFRLPTDIPIIEVSQLGLRQNALAQLKGDAVIAALRKRCGLVLSCNDVAALYAKGGFENIRTLIQKFPNVYIKATNPFYDLKKIPTPLNFIKPAPSVNERVIQTMGGSRCIGVHVRRTDHAEAIQNSPLELFIEKMKACLEENPHAKFYVASDDNSVLSELEKTFPAKITTLTNRYLARDYEQGIIDAYVEMLCLSRCDKILGSYNSTFSSIAAMIGDIPLEVVSKKIG